MFQTLISGGALHALQAGTAPAVLLDCRFQLADPDYGTRAYAAGHLPGAHYLHLDHDLSGAKTGCNGRHPLPELATLAARLAALGVGDGRQVVAYDDAGGMFAARAWWLLRLMGHAEVAVLDGGVSTWLAAGGELDTAVPAAQGAVFSRRAPLEGTVSCAEVLANLAAPAFMVVDARGADRFAGQNETIDPVAGHIPGARNHPFMQNLAADGRFKATETLAAEWRQLFAGVPAEAAVHQCGSGVTACHNLLALAHAGLPGGRLYPGSWSEWCSDPARPVEAG
ncbi:sulfurtransferase [Crenobacter caeni]|uniref:Sulfurtransferase n=1 Tax=Crenobacter caeni TaxID=2705474 RepID=A0A6B2KMW6_9NEIS|nr:sulfurtransferase [Crenobacter caeni]NDV11431.1 sulfurtransferase [Crenobacter caeni]